MRSFVIAILALAVAWSASGTAVAAVTDPDGLIVRFEPGVSAAERAAIRDEAGTDLERTLPVPGMQLLDLEPGQGRAAAERALERQDGVLYAEPNTVRRASLRPDDLHYSLLWGLENTGQAIQGSAGSIDADTDAWDAGIGGGGAVAVIDSGVDLAHPDLAANAWRNPGESGAGRESNGLDDDLNGKVDDWRGWDFVAGDSDRAGEKVVNLSLGSSTSSRAESDAIAAHPEMLFVAAAGNGGDDGIGDDDDLYPEYPCAYPLPNVVCVAASDNRDRLATFSNYGDLSVDLAAPGVDIVSTLPGDRYGWASGTSMATPHVSGAAALTVGADPIAAFAGRTVSGGRLNVLSSLRLVADVTLGPPAPAPDLAPSPDTDPGDSEGGDSEGGDSDGGDSDAEKPSPR